MDDFIDMILLFENCFYFVFGKKKGFFKDICKFRNDFFVYNLFFLVDEKDIKYCLDRLFIFLS